jgi:hypothetical protein
MSGRTKWWIKATRVIQMGLRVLELIAAVGVLVLFILMNKIEDLTAWVMRITVSGQYTTHMPGLRRLTHR